MKKHILKPSLLFCLVALFLASCGKPDYYVFKTVKLENKSEQEESIVKEDNPALTQEKENYSALKPIPSNQEQPTLTASLNKEAALEKAASSKAVEESLAKIAEMAREVESKEKLNKVQQVKYAFKAKKEFKKIEKELEKSEIKDLDSAEQSSGKSQLVALILVIFVGTLGIHRFYMGYTGIGIIQLITLGACGIWTLIDLIRIATGDLQPADGPWAETI